MQLQISPSLRHVTVLPAKGVRDFIKVKVGSRRVSYQMVFYSLLFITFLLRFGFVLTAIDSIDDENHCSTMACVGKRIWRKRPESMKVPDEIYRMFEESGDQLKETKGRTEVPQSLDEFITDMKSSKSDLKSFALKLKAMVSQMEEKTRAAKIQEYLYRHIASSSIPKQLHCLALKLANEHSTNVGARLQLPSPEFVPSLVKNSLFHFVLASDNVLATSVVATSLVRNSLYPQKVVLHIITDRKTYNSMHSWFSLHPLTPAIIEVKGLHHFDWFTKGKVPVLEAMEKDQSVRSKFRGGSSAIVSNNTDKPYIIASKLQALSPKYNSVMNHIRIHLPELFPSLDKVVFLDDDIVVQTDLSPLWDIDMRGKVNGAVQTCYGDDKLVMSKRFTNYLNFSHPLILEKFDPNGCAWAYGMNIFDLKAWRNTNISHTYHYWLQKNLESDLSLWQLGTLPPGLIAFHGHVHIIDAFWHMLGLGYQDNTTAADAKRAGVIHFNGRAKPWLEIAFPHLRPLWTKYIDFNDKFIQKCHIRAS